MERKQGSLKRIIRLTTLIIILMLLTGLSVIFVPPLFDPVPGFMQRKGKLINSVVQKQWLRGEEKFSDVVLISDSGLKVEMTWRRPGVTNKKLPAVLLLGGYRTGRRAAELIDETGGVVVASVSYPDYVSQHRESGIYSKTRAVQKTIIDTIPSILLTMDYLLQQPGIDSGQVEIAGVSLGAFMVSVPAVLDKRFSRVWLVHGGGDPPSIFEYQLQDAINRAWLRSSLASLVAYLSYSKYLKPERWVGKISPRPVIVVNAKTDRYFPDESVRKLHAALGQHSEVIWLGEQHVQASSKVIVDQIARLLCDRIIKKTAEK